MENKGIVLFSVFAVLAFSVQCAGLLQCTCNDCPSCNIALSNQDCTTVRLTNDLKELPASCIKKPANFNNKTFDCQGHIIDGTDFGIGIQLEGNSNNVIKNCEITDFWYGIYLEDSSNNQITGNTAASNTYGIELHRSSGNAIVNNNAHSNGYGIRLLSSSGNTIAGNVAQSNDYGIELHMSSNNTLYSNRFCANAKTDLNMAALSAENTGRDNVCGAYTGWNDSGETGCTYTCSGVAYCFGCGDCESKLNNPASSVVYLAEDIINHSGGCMNNPEKFNGKIFDCRGHMIVGIEHLSDYGVYLSRKEKNTIQNCEISGFDYGIYLDNSSGNRLIKNRLIRNVWYGIYLENSSGNTLAENDVDSNLWQGVNLVYSPGNVIRDNLICGNKDMDILLTDSPANLLEKNRCDKAGGLEGGSIENVCKYACGSCFCSGCEECVKKLNDPMCSVVNLASNITGYDKGTCIDNPKNFENKTLDCQGNTIDGTDKVLSRGIYLDDKRGGIIRNCIVTDFYEGVYLENSSKITLSNNGITSFFKYGIRLVDSSHNLITNNSASSLEYYTTEGIALQGGSSNNTVKNNNASSNGVGIAMYGSGGNVIAKNTACLNKKNDIYASNASENLAYKNVCGGADGLNDFGFSGCSYMCSGEPGKRKTISDWVSCDPFDKNKVFISGICFDTCEGMDCNDGNASTIDYCSLGICYNDPSGLSGNESDLSGGNPIIQAIYRHAAFLVYLVLAILFVRSTPKHRYVLAADSIDKVSRLRDEDGLMPIYLVDEIYKRQQSALYRSEFLDASIEKGNLRLAELDAMHKNISDGFAGKYALGKNDSETLALAKQIRGVLITSNKQLLDAAGQEDIKTLGAGGIKKHIRHIAKRIQKI